MSDLIDISGFGKLSIASDNDGTSKNATLLVVFGGIPVANTEFDGVKRKKPVYIPSGDYMWNFMNGLKDRYHIFVSASSNVGGNAAYDALIKKMKEKGIAHPSEILYLFSGGGAPGTQLLDSKGADRFSSIFLVDIWMGLGKKHPSPFMPNFYKHFVNTHADKTAYIYTEGGADNSDARDFLVKKLGSQKAIEVDSQVGEDGMQTHLRTNVVALKMIP
ncbi:MAG TPA: hypothetical protein VHW24_15035 [Bryobacteraceae bacterium]|jgi:hypothetical protein|nr:hypothetical protein [Bryobacteraceae bacterium]